MKKLIEAQAVQGDVLIELVSAVPPGARPVPPDGGRHIVARGEVTGHVHAIPAEYGELFECDGVLYLRVGAEPAPLQHEEHEHWMLPAERVVRFRVQRAPSLLDGVRKVLD